MDDGPRRSRMTMAGLAALVVLLAADSAFLRYLASPDRRGMPGDGLKAYLLVILPLVNVLVVGLPRLVGRRAANAPFLAGFEAAGWGAVVAYAIACRLFPVAVSTYFVAIFPPLYNALAKSSDLGNPTANQLYMWFVMFPVCSLVLSLPLLGFALVGGLIGRVVGFGLGRQVESAVKA